jgi:hypothetical protein
MISSYAKRDSKNTAQLCISSPEIQQKRKSATLYCKKRQCIKLALLRHRTLSKVCNPLKIKRQEFKSKAANPTGSTAF